MAPPQAFVNSSPASCGKVVKKCCDRRAKVSGRHSRRGVDLAAEVVDGVVAAPQDAVVLGQPVVVELVGVVGEALAVAPADGVELGRRSAARSPSRSRRRARCSASSVGAAGGKALVPSATRRARTLANGVWTRTRCRRARGRSPWCARRSARRGPRRPPSGPRPGGPGRRWPPGPCATARRGRWASRPRPACASRSSSTTSWPSAPSWSWSSRSSSSWCGSVAMSITPVRSKSQSIS